MPSTKDDLSGITPARDGSPRSKRIPALSAMAALAIVALGLLPINDTKAQQRNGYYYDSHASQQYGWHGK